MPIVPLDKRDPVCHLAEHLAPTAIFHQNTSNVLITMRPSAYLVEYFEEDHAANQDIGITEERPLVVASGLDGAFFDPVYWHERFHAIQFCHSLLLAKLAAEQIDAAHRVTQCVARRDRDGALRNSALFRSVSRRMDEVQPEFGFSLRQLLESWALVFELQARIQDPVKMMSGNLEHELAAFMKARPIAGQMVPFTQTWSDAAEGLTLHSLVCHLAFLTPDPVRAFAELSARRSSVFERDIEPFLQYDLTSTLRRAEAVLDFALTPDPLAKDRTQYPVYSDFVADSRHYIMPSGFVHLASQMDFMPNPNLAPGFFINPGNQIASSFSSYGTGMYEGQPIIFPAEGKIWIPQPQAFQSRSITNEFVNHQVLIANMHVTAQFAEHFLHQ